MCKNSLILVSFLLFSCYAECQDAYGKSFVLGNESAPDKIQTLYQDKKGQLYCGAASGLYLFDGMKFHLYKQDDSLSKSVTSICENPTGEIIVGYESGMIGRSASTRRTRRTCTDSCRTRAPTTPTGGSSAAPASATCRATTSSR